MTSQEFLISPRNFPAYLESRGFSAPGARWSVRELGGGVSNLVLLLESLDHPARRWVAKQSLAKLRVQDDWRSERGRIFQEVAAIQTLGPILGKSCLPEIIHVDRENYLYVMGAAPAGSAAWKDLLLAGQVNPAVARQAAVLLARQINGSRHNATLREKFADQAVFDQLRIDPYYRTTAARQPGVRAAIEQLMQDSSRIRTALVHGDFSPKNLLVRGAHIFLIDFEVAHWGDPAFDSGFLLNHLCLKSFHQPRYAAAYLQAAHEFWSTLIAALPGEEVAGFERLTVRHLGALMLARIDGKSPVEYLRDEAVREQVRTFAKGVLREPPKEIAKVLERLKGEWLGPHH
jgi:5-methylthioribose kinase